MEYFKTSNHNNYITTLSQNRDKQTQSLSAFTYEFIEEINHIRTNPKSYAKKLRTYASFIDHDNVLKFPKDEYRIIVNEGIPVFEEAAAFLESLSKMNELIVDNNLSLVADAISKEISYYSSITDINQINQESIISNFGHFKGVYGQSIDLGSETAETVIMNLVVDDGTVQRKNRYLMFNPRFLRIGCASIKHNVFKWCTVIIYGVEFICDGHFQFYFTENIGDTNYNRITENSFIKPQNMIEEDVYDEEMPPGVNKIFKSEKFVVENGRRKKITRTVKFLENGEIETEIYKEIV